MMGTAIPIRESFHQTPNVSPNPSQRIEAALSGELLDDDSLLDIIVGLRAENAQLRLELQQARAGETDTSTDETSRSDVDYNDLDYFERSSIKEEDSEQNDSSENDLQDDDTNDRRSEDRHSENWQNADGDRSDRDDDDDSTSSSLPPPSSSLQQSDEVSEDQLNRLRLRLSHAEREIYANRQLSTISLDFARRCLPRRRILETARPPWKEKKQMTERSKARARCLMESVLQESRSSREPLAWQEEDDPKGPGNTGSRFREARLRHEREVGEQEEDEAEQKGGLARQQHMRVKSHVDDKGRPTVTFSADLAGKKHRLKRKKLRRRIQLGKTTSSAISAGNDNDVEAGPEDMLDHVKDEDGGVSITE